MNPTLQQFNKYAVIPPPDTPTENVKYTRVAIDSKDRQKNLFPSPNAYEIKLNNEVSDVISAKLINADIPMCMHTINQYFDTIRLLLGSSTYDVKLDHGTYNENELVSMITDKFNAVSPNTFQVTYNTVRDGFSFGSTQNFALVFGESDNSLDALLGFSKTRYNATNTGATPYTYVINSSYRKNFNFNNCIIMYIDQFDSYQSPTNDMDRCFAILPSVYNHLSIADNPELIKTFSPAIPRMNKFIVKFLDRYGNPYDFQNMEHRFEILLTSHKQGRKYTAIWN